MREDKMLPSARKEGVLIQELAADLLVYDLETHKAHCLNKVAALVWENCDGRSSVQDIARSLTYEMNARIDEEIVWLALDQLEKARLLESNVPRPADKPKVSRREMMRRAGIAAMIAIPVVTSILAPEALAGGVSCGAPCGGVNICVAPGCLNCTELPGAVCTP